MILLVPRGGGPVQGAPSAIALFGSGRVGSAVLEALEAPGDLLPAVLPFTWSKPGGLAAEGREVVARAARAAAPGGRAAVVWCAGACGFSATEEATRAEMAAFLEVLGLARALASRGDVEVDFHLLSSAGGIFEGRTDVGPGDPPGPRRPYGRLKLEQEVRAAAEGGLRARIYRVASVYGPLRPGYRMGLVCTLVANTAADRVTPIFGDLETRRDYVLSRDVGEAVARGVREGGGARAPRTLLLASGRATTIREAVEVVGRVLGRAPRVEVAPSGENSSPISFSPRALPEGFRPVDLESGVRIVRDDLKSLSQ